MSVFALTNDDRARAAEHAAFARREAAKTGLPADTPQRPVQRVGVDQRLEAHGRTPLRTTP